MPHLRLEPHTTTVPCTYLIPPRGRSHTSSLPLTASCLVSHAMLVFGAPFHVYALVLHTTTVSRATNLPFTLCLCPIPYLNPKQRPYPVPYTTFMFLASHYAHSLYPIHLPRAVHQTLPVSSVPYYTCASFSVTALCTVLLTFSVPSAPCYLYMPFPMRNATPCDSFRIPPLIPVHHTTPVLYAPLPPLYSIPTLCPVPHGSQCPVSNPIPTTNPCASCTTPRVPRAPYRPCSLWQIGTLCLMSQITLVPCAQYPLCLISHFFPVPYIKPLRHNNSASRAPHYLCILCPISCSLYHPRVLYPMRTHCPMSYTTIAY